MLGPCVGASIVSSVVGLLRAQIGLDTMRRELLGDDETPASLHLMMHTFEHPPSVHIELNPEHAARCHYSADAMYSGGDCGAPPGRLDTLRRISA